MLCRLNGLALMAGMAALGSICAVSAHAAGDPAAGTPAAAVAVAGDPVVGEKKFYTCVGCHGIDDYKNAYPDYSVPRLRHQNSGYIISALQEYKSGERPHGQHVDYLEQALTTYRNGRRKNVVMDGMAQLLKTEEDVKVVAAYFASQPSPLATAKTTSK